MSSIPKSINFWIVLALMMSSIALVSGSEASQAWDISPTGMQIAPSTGSVEPQIIGGDKDEHGCYIAAGYSWCEAKQKCIRSWEEDCITVCGPCIQYVAPAPGWCANGTIVASEKDECGCQSPPDCVIACTMDAKICPDGTAVGRVAPNCEFAPCPNCKSLWWFDSNSRECSKKEFCGAYMYQGLQTFTTKEECDAALPGLSSCTDSDSGKNYYVSGQCYVVTTSMTVPVTPQKAADACVDEKSLSECYCDANTIKTEAYVCPYGCKNGACLAGEGACYSNNDCTNTQFCEFSERMCKGPGKCVAKTEVCTAIYSPVCGCDKKTYSSDCTRQSAGVSKLYNGECKNECPVETVLCVEGTVAQPYVGDDGCKHFRCVTPPVIACEAKGGYCISELDECREGYTKSYEDLGCSARGPATIMAAEATTAGSAGGQVPTAQVVSTATQTASVVPPTPTQANPTVITTPDRPVKRLVCCLPSVPATQNPSCEKIGTPNEGWYAGGKLVKLDDCACEAVCKGAGTRSEGYFSSCTGELIEYATCSATASVREQKIEVTLKERPVEVEQNTADGVVEVRSQATAVTTEKLRVEETKLSMVTPEGVVTEINYLPEEARQKAIESAKMFEVSEIRLVDENGAPVYEIDGKVRARILWIIPVTRDATVRVDATTNALIE